MRRYRPYLVPATVFLALGALVLVARDAITPFLVGALYVAALDPFVTRLAPRIGRGWAAALVIVASIAFLLGGAALLVTPLIDQAALVVGDLPAMAARVQADLDRFLTTLPPQLGGAARTELAQLVEALAAALAAAAPAGAALLGSLAGTLFAYTTIPFFAFYVLRDRPRLTQAASDLLPRRYRPDGRAVLAITGAVLGRWLRAQVVLSAAVGAGVFAVLTLLGLLVDPVFGRYALVLALLAALLESLPIVGPILSAIPAVALGVVVGGPGPAAAVLASYVAIQQLEGSVLVPRISGRAIRVHPSVVLIAIPVGAAVAGPLGAVLALPVAALTRDLALYAGARLAERPASPTVAARRAGIELAPRARGR
jgi:predicted PurR-regulated permease PerM